MMTESNHLPANLLTGEFGIGQHIMHPGFGYGFNCGVFVQPRPRCPQSTFFWDVRLFSPPP